MSDHPDDCGFNSQWELPWAEPNTTECPQCGSPMGISTFDRDKLICENDNCCDTIDFSPSGLSGDW
jgi:ssDNA-binding Zn-finger/Zn-ribbon topoisomerase 1